jgi:Na+-driven multidrug efflux pump
LASNHRPETLVLAWRDWRPGAVSRARRARRTAIVVALVAGVALGALLLPHAAPWSHLIAHR